MANKSRAEYFRKRRETKGQFMVLVDKPVLNKLDEVLRQRKLSRAEWLREKIEHELKGI
jgi:predicted HicB family RNase H-like nuclease